MKYVILCGNVLDNIDGLTDKHCAVHFMYATLKSITDTMELNKQMISFVHLHCFKYKYFQI